MEISRRFLGPPRVPGYHPLFEGDGFVVQDCVCHCGRDSPAFENVFGRHRVAVIIGGTFHYQSDFGPTMLGPGSMLLGSAGGGYCYRHVDDGGDRSVAFDFSDELLGEVWHADGRSGRAGFRAASIPASPHTAAAAVATLRALNLGGADSWEETALLIATTALADATELNAASASLWANARDRVSGTERRKIARALRHVEAHHREDCSLRVLADEAGMSIYRFLRLFKRMTSQTPRQYLMATRLRAAATRLLETPDKVLDIAFDVGFGDISHFNQSFAAAFGASPTQFRSRHGVLRTRQSP
jgi:AraC family transcriptional regulator